MVIVAVESLVLGALCLFDLAATVLLIRSGLAVEANPLLDFYIKNGGMIAFIGAKLLLTLGPLFALEVLRRNRPQFVRLTLRLGIVLYLLAYGIGGVFTNTPVQANSAIPSSAGAAIR
jgi:hypothetical protein